MDKESNLLLAIYIRHYSIRLVLWTVPTALQAHFCMDLFDCDSDICTVHHIIRSCDRVMTRA